MNRITIKRSSFTLVLWTKSLRFNFNKPILSAFIVTSTKITMMPLKHIKKKFLSLIDKNLHHKYVMDAQEIAI